MLININELNKIPAKILGEREVLSEGLGDESRPAPNSDDGILDRPGWEEDKFN